MRYSEKEAFNSCPFKYKMIQDGFKKQKDNESLHHRNWGAAIHAGLETHYNKRPFVEVEAAFKKLYPVNLDAMDNAKTVTNGVEVLRRYVKFYEEQDMAWDVLATEYEDTIAIGDEEHSLHIDLVARHKQSREIYFWDHKTSGKEPGAMYWKGFELSGQITRYTASVMEKFGECAGCYINNISVKHLKIKNKYGDGPGLVVKFDRQLFNRSPQQIKYWRESDEGWMRQIEFCKKEGVWSCALNGSCAYCEFYDLCLASGDEQIKELLYKPSEHEFNVEVV